MMASRGMGAISPSKIPRGKKIERKDDPNTVDMYKRGGKVKKYSGEDESLVKKENESLVKMTKKDLSGSGEQQKPDAEEFATNQYKQRPVNVAQMQEGANFSPSGGEVNKYGKVFGGRGSYTHKLSDNTALEAYADMKATRNKDGTQFKVPSYGARITHSFAGGGLYDNIHAKQKRIAEGSGEKMRKVGAKGAPTKADFVKSAKTARKK
jgi:hypothetical protein